MSYQVVVCPANRFISKRRAKFRMDGLDSCKTVPRASKSTSAHSAKAANRRSTSGSIYAHGLRLALVARPIW
jgi:hypothetical protein